MSSTLALTHASPRAKQPVRLIGQSQPMTALLAAIERVARSDAKVLICGESGVGKEIVTRAIHDNGPRSKKVFAVVNCAGLPETLLESELFGHVKGSFTGAYRDKPGKLESAHMGTVFLDEIGEMSLRMQGLLLRFLETGEVQRVGADGGVRDVNVRVIGATNRNLREMITQGTFREDLYYRLNVVRITVPPLRERRVDIPELVNHFLDEFVAANQSPIIGVSAEAMNALAAYSWPGNVRELANLIERMVVAGHHDIIELQDLPSELRGTHNAGLRPRRERRRTIADDLYLRLTEQGESFWLSVRAMYMSRDISRADVREVVRRGLEQTRGDYRMLAELFNMEPAHHRRFLNFLKQHDCLLPFREYR
jgi:transcriptional regulator with PAS, ATPase and Fis domain